MSQIDVLVKTVDALTIVGGREVVPVPKQMRERCIALNNRAWGLIEAVGLKTDGISFALYYSAEANGIDVEMAYVIDAPQAVPAADTAQMHTLPVVTVAYAVYDGSYDDFGAVGRVHGALYEWIEANGYRISGATREFYLRPPKDSPLGVMEIQYPVEKDPQV